VARDSRTKIEQQKRKAPGFRVRGFEGSWFMGEENKEQAVKTRNDTIKSYKESEVKLAKETYILTRQLPKEKLYGLTFRIRRDNVSIPSNIPDSQKRCHEKEFIQVLYKALGSLGKLQTQPMLPREIYNIELSSELLDMADTFGKKARKINSILIKSRSSSSNNKPREMNDGGL